MSNQKLGSFSSRHNFLLLTHPGLKGPKFLLCSLYHNSTLSSETHKPILARPYTKVELLYTPYSSY